MIEVTRRYAFCASHRLHSAQLSEKQNQALYGKCNNPYGHGHNYQLEVTVSGPIHQETGRIIDLSALDSLVKKHVLEPFDHRNLNQESIFFQQLVPTTENLCVIIENQLREAWSGAFPGVALQRIRIYETARNIFVI